jgi:hypothetical protein
MPALRAGSSRRKDQTARGVWLHGAGSAQSQWV